MSEEAGLTPAARLARGVLCAVLAVFLAGASHAVAGGTVPVVTILMSLPLGALVCVILAGRQLSLPRVALGVGVSQVVFHFLFDFFAGMPSVMTSTMMVSAGHRHEGILATPLVPMVAGSASSTDGMDAGMIASHLVAGLATVALVRRGEYLWWSLVGIIEAVVSTIVRLIRLCPVTEESRRGFLEYAPYGLYELLQGDTRLRLRGPPARELSFS
jgi:hypothetical protein